MKKLLLLFSAFLAVSAYAGEPNSINKTKHTPGDRSIGVGLRFGYGGYMGAQTFQQSQDWDGFNLRTNTQLYGSMGRGIVAGVNADWMFTDYLGLGLAAEQLFGSRSDFDIYKNTSGYSSMETVRGYYTGISMEMVMRTCCEGALQGTARFGPTVMASSGYISEFNSYQDGALQYNIEQRIQNRVGIGVSGQVGAEYRVSDNLSVNLGFGGLLFSGKQKSGEYTVYNDKGTDNLPNMKTSEKMFNYLDQLDQNSNTPGNSNYSQDKPRDFLSNSNSYQRRDIRLGVRMTF